MQLSLSFVLNVLHYKHRSVQLNWFTIITLTHIHTSSDADSGVPVYSGPLRSAMCTVLTTRVEQRQRFRQREGLKERSAVADAVEHAIYRAQWTEGCSHTSTTEGANYYYVQSTPGRVSLQHNSMQWLGLIVTV